MTQHRLLDDNTPRLFAEVLIARPARALDRPFTYRVPENLRGRLQLGSYVFVPFGREKLGGYVIGLTAEAPAFDTKEILSLLSEEPVFDEDLLALARWVADRYRSPLADAIHLILPPGAAQKPVARVELTEAGRADGALAEVAGSPRQVEVLALLQKAVTPISRSEVIRAGIRAGMKPPAVGGALKGLEERGLVTVTRGLAAPAARRLTRQVVQLAEEGEPWLEIIEKLYKRAPRQAEALERLLEAEDQIVALAELSHSAVKSLESKGLVHIVEEHVERLPEEAGMGEEEPNFLQLTCDQARILEWVIANLERREFAACLIRGVTGSGKTEVYLHSIEQTLRRGRNAIVLVPEISLTPQMVGRFRARFGGQLALLHSALSAGERFDEWQRIARGEARIVVGARSALFAPVKHLGIIVVDEEHDRAYKQDSSPRYHAVAVAEQRARQAGAVLLMGGATPSMESYWRASDGNRGLETAPTTLRELPERIDDRPMPTVEIIDLRQETLLGRGQTFSQRISDEMQQRIDRGEQIILFLNRRGFSTFVMCRDCGFALRCPDCAVALIYHHHTKSCRCHHCDYLLPAPDFCPNCGGHDMKFQGQGTERVAERVEREFAGATVARMDRDTVAHKGAYGDILRRFARGEANVLVGTQMIAKGLHFPAVTLVAVLNADVGLHRPDFRAAEQTFQLLTQVSGRAGREDKPGLALVQTYNPDHFAITAAAQHDYVGFYTKELAARKENLYPPFVVLANLVFSGPDEAETRAEAYRCQAMLKQMGVREKEGELQFLGPAEAPLHRLRGMWRYQMLLKAPDMERLHDMLVELEKCHKAEPKRFSMIVDVEPFDMM